MRTDSVTSVTSGDNLLIFFHYPNQSVGCYLIKPFKQKRLSGNEPFTIVSHLSFSAASFHVTQAPESICLNLNPFLSSTLNFEIFNCLINIFIHPSP